MKIKPKMNRLIYITIIALFVIGMLTFLSSNLFTDGITVMKGHKAIETTVHTKVNTNKIESDEMAEKIDNPVASSELNETAFIDVSVATLWTKPNLNRAIDNAAIRNPVDMWEWTESMTLAEKKWLIGKLQTQALYGEPVTVLDVIDGWARVAVHGQPNPEHTQGYVAWMPVEQLVYETTYENTAQKNTFIMVTNPTAWLYSDEEMQVPFMEVSYNTRLPVIKQIEHKTLIATPADGNKWVPTDSVAIYKNDGEITKPTGDMLVQSGKQFLGLPYVWAGTSGFGFDCSGFTYSLFKAHGIIIPRDSSVQATHGTAVAKESLRKGDLLFFADKNGEGFVHHVGMYTGNGEMIHAPNSDSAVEMINVFESDYWSNEYAGARRYID